MFLLMIKKLNFKKWEWALLLSLLLTFTLGAFWPGEQESIESKVTRLHVLANSDSEEDQALKLLVRDGVLEEAKKWEGKPMDAAFLSAIQKAAQKVVLEEGCHYPVQVEKRDTYFDTREYDTFSLPAGVYDALRVTIGEGKGHNWWCVLLPPLCAPACEEEFLDTAQENFSPGEIRYMTGDGLQYKVRFKVAELLSQLCHALG